MGDAIRRAGVFFHDVKDVLRRKSGERSKCPRCRGSGLLYLQSIWQRSSSNTPCLFCEGVGVMPIIGLRGYILGRTDAMLSTKEPIKNRNMIDVHSTDATDTNSERTSTKISTRRHFKVVSHLLHNPLSNPVWLLEAQREASLVKSSQNEPAEHSLDHNRDSDDRSPVGLIGLDQAGWRYRHRFYARTSAPFSNPTNGMSNDSNSRPNSMPTAEEKPLHNAQGSELKGFTEDVDSRSRVQSRDSEMSSTRGHGRSARRPRNKIREKAEKEAEARAQRVQKPVSVNSWSPVLRMCRLLRGTSSDPKKKMMVPSIQEIPSSSHIITDAT